MAFSPKTSYRMALPLMVSFCHFETAPFDLLRVVLSRCVPGQLTLDHILLGMVRFLGCPHQPGQIFVRIQTGLGRRLAQAEHDCTASSTLRRIYKHEILPDNDEGLNTACHPSDSWSGRITNPSGM